MKEWDCKRSEYIMIPQFVSPDSLSNYTAKSHSFKVAITRLETLNYIKIFNRAMFHY